MGKLVIDGDLQTGSDYRVILLDRQEVNPLSKHFQTKVQTWNAYQQTAKECDHKKL